MGSGRRKMDKGHDRGHAHFGGNGSMGCESVLEENVVFSIKDLKYIYTL